MQIENTTFEDITSVNIEFRTILEELLLEHKLERIESVTECRYMNICDINVLIQTNVLDLSSDCPFFRFDFLINRTSHFSRIQSLFRFYNRRFDQGDHQQLSYYMENQHLQKYKFKSVISETNISSWIYSEPNFPKEISLIFDECMDVDIVLQFSFQSEFVLNIFIEY